MKMTPHLVSVLTCAPLLPLHRPRNSVCVSGLVLALAVVAGPGGCFAQALAVSPTTAAVIQGQSLTFTSSQPAAWSLTAGSAGTLTVNSPTSVTYTAPPTVTPQGTLAGCQTTPSDSVFNTRIDNLPVEARSASWISNMHAGGLTVVPDFGTNIVDVTTPMANQSFLYTPQNNGPFPQIAQEVEKRQVGAYQTDLTTGSTDRHMLAVNRNTCTFYEVYKNYFAPRSCGSKTCTATSGVVYTSSSYALPGLSTQASNLLFGPLMIRLAEVKSGAINHALSFTEAQYSVHPLSYWPANSTLGVGSVGPPYGARFRLKSSFDISTFSANAQTVLRALQQYGMFLSDASVGGAVVYTDTDVTLDAGVMNAFTEIANAKVPMTSFDAVDESSFMVNSKSMQVNPLNGYQTPANYAVLNVSSGSGKPVAIPIALGSAATGVSSPTLFIVAGTPSYQIQSWLAGWNSEAPSWTLLSGVGSVTPWGVYTPPASVTAPTNAVLQGAPNSNPTLTANVYVTVLPAGTNPVGSVRIDVGSPVSTKSAGGTKTWLADIAYEAGNDVSHSDYPKWTHQTDPDIGVYQTYHHTSGNDLTYSLGLPNGNYRVRMMFGAPYNGHGCAAPPCVYDVTTYPTDWGPYNLVANGQVVAHNFDFGVGIAHQEGTPSDAYIPAQVINNQLTLSVRGYRPDSRPGLAIVLDVLEGIEILPDNTPPYLAIDTQQQITVAAGNNLQLYSVGWYMSNAVNWSIVAGEGSIDQSGIYTAPYIAPTADETITIQAVSTADGTTTATTNLIIPGSSNE